MTEFGQNLIPKIYEDNTFRTFSKAGMLSHIVRALQTVGMVPLTSTWPFDPIATPEFPLQQGQVYVFAFDYPDDGGTLTFNVNGTLYRPGFAIIVGHGNENATTNPGRIEKSLIFDSFIRIDGAVSMDNIFPMSRTRGITGLAGFGTGISTITTVYINQEGGYVTKEDWLPNVGSAAANDQTLPIGHWFVYLGPGGLFIYAGSGNLRAAFGDIMAGGAMFAGARLPGRARPISEDSNLNRMNPIIPFWSVESNTLATGSSFYSTSATVPLFERIFRPKVHRMQSDLKFTEDIVDSWLFNLENVEYPIFPLYQPDTRPSPRALLAGGGGHILGVPVHVPDGREDDATDKFSPIVPELNASEVRPKFEDVFSCPGCRFCDVTAPLGLATDPNTNLDWYLFPTYNSGQLLGVLQENGSIVSALSTLTLTPTGSDFYNMVTSGWSSTFPTTVLVQTTGSNAPVTEWVDDPGTDRQIFTVPSASGTFGYQVEWDIQVAVADPADTVYQMSFAAFNRDDPQSGTNPAEGVNALIFEYFFNGAWVPTVTIECAGANQTFVNTAGQVSYFANTYTSFIAKETSQATPRFLVRWNAVGNFQVGSNGEVTTITINKFRYL